MKVLVFAKQIPDVNKITFNPETGRIVRENVPLMFNSFDKKAVEEAIRMKEKHGWETAVATMGPPQSGEIINESLRMGIDRGYLLTDRKFAGSDTLVTSRILAEFVKQIKPDIVLMGKYSLDGETSQVPPEVALLAGYGFRSSVSKIDIDPETGKLLVEHEDESGLTKYRLGTPALFSVSEKINRARKIPDDAPQKTDQIEIVDSKRIGLDIEGMRDSPTVVEGTEQITSDREVEFIQFDDNVYAKVKEILERQVSDQGHEEVVTLPEYDPSGETIMGVAIDDVQASMEIAGKITELANQNELNVIVAGNIDPRKLEGMSCHRYIHIKADETDLVPYALIELIRKLRPKHVVYPSTIIGREISSVVAAKLGLGLTADCIDLKIREGKLVQYKPAFGGGIVASIVSKTTPDMATARPGMFKLRKGKATFEIEELAVSQKSPYEKLSFEPVSSEYKPLGSSETIIGVGRGVKSKALLPEILKLASLLGASVGGTRPVVDMRWMPRQQQIGLTGTSISPKSYISLGVSGQDNHIVGIRYADKVIAVDLDKEAPIFKHADYGILADVKDFVEGFVSYLSRQ